MLRAYDQANPQMARSELQKKVHDTLELQDLFVVFPDDDELETRINRWN
jgi:hypothetical protein